MENFSSTEQNRMKKLQKLLRTLRYLYIPVFSAATIIIIIIISIIMDDNPPDADLLNIIVIVCAVDFTALLILSATISKFKAEYASCLIINKNELEKIITEKTNELESIYRGLPDHFFQIDHDGTIKRILGWPESENNPVTENLNRNIKDLIPCEIRKDIEDAISQAAEENRISIAECEIPSEGRIRNIECRFVPAANDLITCVIRDISQRKDSERSLRKALREQEILMREVHHRVKNNLMMIISIISFYDNDENKSINPADLKNKLYTISLIHEKLYNKEMLSEIELNDYMTDLAGYLISSFEHRNIRLYITIPPASYTPEKIIPIGLITSELLSIALKYWPEKEDADHIRIDYEKKDDEIEINYFFSNLHFIGAEDLKKTEPVGLSLIRLLTKQLDGIIIESEEETSKKIVLKFPA